MFSRGSVGVGFQVVTLFAVDGVTTSMIKCWSASVSDSVPLMATNVIGHRVRHSEYVLAERLCNGSRIQNVGHTPFQTWAMRHKLLHI